MQIKQSSAAPITQFKVAIIGDPKVGKTTFINRFMPYSATNSNQANLIQTIVNTSQGPFKITLIDAKQSYKEPGLQQSYFGGLDGAIIMFDVTDIITYNSLPFWYQEVTRMSEKTIVLIVGNKVDQKDRKVKPKQITLHRKLNLQYYDISCKENYQIEKCILYILRGLVKNDLVIIQKITFHPIQTILQTYEVGKDNNEQLTAPKSKSKLIQ